MTDQDSALDQDHPKFERAPSAFHTIVYGGLAIGVLDGIAATVNAGIRGTSPVRVWQYVASSVLGSESFNGGAATMILGIVFHFLVAFGVASVYYVLVRNFPILLRRALTKRCRLRRAGLFRNGLCRRSIDCGETRTRFVERTNYRQHYPYILCRLAGRVDRKTLRPVNPDAQTKRRS